VHLAAPHVERDVVVGDDARELLADAPHLEDEVVGHESHPTRKERGRARSPPSSCNRASGYGALPGLELAGDDLSTCTVHQADPRLRHLRADLADAHAVVLEVEDEVLPPLKWPFERTTVS
jgi:hypothetical protein